MAPSGGWASRGRRGGRQQRPGRAIMDDEDDDFDDDEEDDEEEEDDDEYGDIEESFKHARAWADARSETGSRSGRSHASIYGASRQQQEKQQQYENGSAAGGFGSSILGVQSIPAIYKTGDGACAVDIPLSNVGTIKALLEAVVHLGQAMVDADISAATIKVHYATGPGVKPRRSAARRRCGISRARPVWSSRRDSILERKSNLLSPNPDYLSHRSRHSKSTTTCSPTCAPHDLLCALRVRRALELVKPPLESRMVSELINELLERPLVDLLAVVEHLDDVRLALLVLRLERANHTVKGLTPLAVLDLMLPNVRLLLLHEIDAILVLLDALLEHLDLFIDDVELELLVQHAARDAGDGSFLRADLQLLLLAVAGHRDDRVEARVFDVGAP